MFEEQKFADEKPVLGNRVSKQSEKIAYIKELTGAKILVSTSSDKTLTFIISGKVRPSVRPPVRPSVRLPPIHCFVAFSATFSVPPLPPHAYWRIANNALPAPVPLSYFT